MLFWASNCSTSSSSFSTSSDGTRFRGKALRSRKGRGKTKPCGPRCLLHLHILDKVFPCLLPFNLRNCTDRLKDRHEMTCMNKSCWNVQPQRQRLSTNRNKYCILHSELSSNEEKIMQDFEVSQAVKLQLRHFQFGLRCWACVHLSLGSSERGVEECAMYNLYICICSYNVHISYHNLIICSQHYFVSVSSEHIHLKTGAFPYQEDAQWRIDSLPCHWMPNHQPWPWQCPEWFWLHQGPLPLLWPLCLWTVSATLQFDPIWLPITHWEIHKLHQSISPLDHYIKSTAEMADKRQVLVADMEGPFTNRFRLKVLHVKNTSNISSGIFNVLTCLTHIPCPRLVLSPNLQPPVPGTPLVACAAFASLLPWQSVITSPKEWGINLSRTLLLPTANISCF